MLPFILCFSEKCRRESDKEGARRWTSQALGHFGDVHGALTNEIVKDETKPTQFDLNLNDLGPLWTHIVDTYILAGCVYEDNEEHFAAEVMFNRALAVASLFEEPRGARNVQGIAPPLYFQRTQKTFAFSPLQPPSSTSPMTCPVTVNTEHPFA